MGKKTMTVCPNCGYDPNAKPKPRKRVEMIYSIGHYENEDKVDAPIGEFVEEERDKVVHQGKAKVVIGADDFFGGEGSKPYESPVLENPTMGDVCAHAEIAMNDYNHDFHHQFFEGCGVKKIGPDGVAIIEVYLGS